MKRDNDDFAFKALIVELTIILIIIVISVLGTNSCSSSRWNNGICPKCGIRYELRAATNGGLKYYACPNCGEEVKRY